jgi:polysaccharide biosynthesis transport protein
MNVGEMTPQVGSFAALLRRRGIWIITILPAFLLVSIFLAYALPTEYQSTATIILEPTSIPQELIKTTVVSYANQQIEVIEGRVMTLDTLTALVQAYDPYPDMPQLSARQKAQRIIADTTLERVDPVTFEPLLESTAFSLHYQNADPNRASIVCGRLADLFLTYHQRERAEQAKAAANFIAQGASNLAKELTQLDEQYAQLRVKYGEALPDAKDRNEAGRDRADRDLDAVERDLRAAQQQESLLELQLNGISPNLLSNKGDMTDLATVKALLADAEQRYTPDHPDVKRLRAALASLIAQGAKDTGTPLAKADNPEYIRVAGQLQAAHKEVQALEGNEAKVRAQYAQYTDLLRRSPEAEREFNELQRQRDSVQLQYQQMQDKLKSAELGQVFEESGGKQGEHFSLIRAPFAASTPYYPNRLGLILLGFVLGGAVAAVAVSVAEVTDVTIRGSRDLIGLEDIRLLGGIPEILRPDDRRHFRLVWGSVSAVYLLAAIMVAVTVIKASRL